MTVQDHPEVDELRTAVMSRRRAEVATLDYRRSLKHLERQGRTQVEIARALGISQPSLHSALKTARTVPEAEPGFSGAGPYEICQRYSIGQISREELVDQLSRWEYAPIPQPEWLEDIVPAPEPGSWFEVERAMDEGLIDDAIYDEVQDRRFPSAS